MRENNDCSAVLFPLLRYVEECKRMKDKKKNSLSKYKKIERARRDSDMKKKSTL